MSQLPDFYNKLESASTSPINKIAVKILLHTFVRTGEMRQGRWEHIDWEAKEWRIPAEHTKMRERHIVPLSRQVITLLRELQGFTGSSGYLFPSHYLQKNPIMSENTINMVIKKIGYSGQMVGHGFRALASTALNEMGFRPDIIERQLAHAERNKVRAAYNRAEYLSERHKMRQEWADKVDSLVKSLVNETLRHISLVRS